MTFPAEGLTCRETPYGEQLVLTTRQGRVMLDGDQGVLCLQALLDWMGIDEVMEIVNDWCRAHHVRPWGRMT